MNKEEALVEFLKGLRVAIHNSLAYQPEHPYFLKSTQEFKQKTDNLFDFLNPIKINVTPESLFLEGKTRDKDVFSLELAQILHNRKVKSLEFRLGLEVKELVTFLSLISLQPKEIIKKHGLSVLLKESGIEHIFVEELDYSQLLGGEGQETKDIWSYLFKGTLEKQDAQKINELADSFLEGVNSLSVSKIIEDDKLRLDLSNFLGHLKNVKNDKFSKCIQQLSKVILDSGNQVSSEDIAKLKEVFTQLKDNDFADILLAQIAGQKKLNVINFELFSQLAGRERMENIPSLLANNKGWPQDNPVPVKKIQALLSGPDSENMSPAYRNALSALVRDVTFKGTLSFDRSQLLLNYRMVMLSFFDNESSQEGIELILRRLRKDWESSSLDEDYHFLRIFFGIAEKKKSSGVLAANDFISVEKWIAYFLERDMWVEPLSLDQVYLLNTIQNTYLSAGNYLDKIFRENKCNIYVLRRFINNFPSQMDAFYEQLKGKYSDLELLNKVITIFVQLNLPISLIALKQIYSSGNEMVKAVVLKAMQRINEIDPEFIFSILTEKSATLKKEALAVLIPDAVARRKGIDILLNISSPWGSKNQLILENMRIVEGLSLRDAKDYLARISQRRFFWNSEVRKKALGVLRSWG